MNERIAIALVSGTLAAMAGCTREASVAPPPGIAAAPKSAARQPAARATEAPAEPVVTALPPLEVGFAARPRVGAAARKANREGLEHHRAGRFEQALARFEAAIGKSSDHDLARYNLACALARRARVEESIAQLDVLVPRDPRRFVARVRTDEDLAAVRESPAWTELARRLDAAEHGWAAAFDRGLPASFYDHEEPVELAGGPPQTGTRDLVVGLYLHDAGRFVPISHDGEYGFVDVARRRAVRIDSGRCEGPSHTPGRETEVTVEDAAPGGTTKLHVDVDRETAKPLGADADHAGHCVYPERVAMAAADDGLWLDIEYLGWDGTKHGALLLDAHGLTRAADAPLGPRFELVVEGAVMWDPAPFGHALKGQRYRPPGARKDVDLGRGHRKPRWQSIVVTPDGAFAFITTIEHWDGPNIDQTVTGILRHAVSRVDLRELRVTELAKGRGSARTVIGPDGALYLDAGGRVQRWSDPAAAPSGAEAVMEGLRLAPPIEPPDCGLCG
jgi:hypothetical protein